MVSNTNKLTQEHLFKKYNKTAISKREYASEIGVSVSTIDNYISKNDGIPKYIRLGSSKNAKIVFPISEVVAFLSKTMEVDDEL